MAARWTATSLSDPVTKHLRQDFACVRVGQTAGEALQWIRARAPKGRIVYFYVVDDDGRLCGVVPGRELILAEPSAPLAQITITKVIAVPNSASVLDACEFFIQHRILAFPVVDEQKRILGVVDVDLYADELLDLGYARERDDVFQRIGVHLGSVQQMSPWSAFRSRFPWLGCNMAAGILAAILCGAYEKELNKVVAIAFFIPVVLNLAESVSSQSVSLALQALHEQRASWRTLLTGLRREMLTGVLLGVGSGAIVALASAAWLGHLRLAWCLLGAIGAGVAASAMLGLSLPVFLRLLRLEPRVAAGPIALAGADVITILIYFNLARWLLA